MKNIFLAFVLLTSFQFAGAQSSNDSIPIFRRFPAVPPFTVMTAPDSTAFTKADLKKKRPVVIIYFSPDCDHCKHFTKELLSHYSLFKKAQIVMASALNYDIIKKFYEEYKIADYPNIKMGRDGTDFFRTFFSVKSFPTIVVYDKKGNLVNLFSGTVSIEKIAEEL